MAEQNVPFKKSLFGFAPEKVMSYVDELLKNSDFDQIRIADLEKQIAQRDNRIAELTAELDAAKADAPVQEDKCATCDIQKRAQILLGETMFDVKRFSAYLVNEAKQKAQTTISGAQDTAGAVSEKARVILGNVDDISSNFSTQFDDLRSLLSSLATNLDDFRKGIGLDESVVENAPDVVKESLKNDPAPSAKTDSEVVADMKAEIYSELPTDIVENMLRHNSEPATKDELNSVIPSVETEKEAAANEEEKAAELHEEKTKTEDIGFNHPFVLKGTSSIVPPSASSVNQDSLDISVPATDDIPPEEQIPVNLIRDSGIRMPENGVSPFADLFEPSFTVGSDDNKAEEGLNAPASAQEKNTEEYTGKTETATNAVPPEKEVQSQPVFTQPTAPVNSEARSAQSENMAQGYSAQPQFGTQAPSQPFFVPQGSQGFVQQPVPEGYNAAYIPQGMNPAFVQQSPAQFNPGYIPYGQGFVAGYAPQQVNPYGGGFVPQTPAQNYQPPVSTGEPAQVVQAPAADNTPKAPENSAPLPGIPDFSLKMPGSEKKPAQSYPEFTLDKEGSENKESFTFVNGFRLRPNTRPATDDPVPPSE